MTDARREEVVEQIRAWVNRMKASEPGAMFWTSGINDFDPIFEAYDNLTQRLAAAMQLLKDHCDEMEVTCPKGCDSYGHVDECGVYSIGQTVRNLKAEKAAAEELLEGYKTDLQRLRAALEESVRVIQNSDGDWGIDICGHWFQDNMTAQEAREIAFAIRKDLAALTGPATGERG